MDAEFVPVSALSGGVHPHRDRLKVAVIRFPKAILINEGFEVTPRGRSRGTGR
jgi:hypothetical protein